jgi:hypothetical protein
MHWLMLLYSRRWVSALSGSVRGRISELIERVTVRGPMQSFKSASQELIHKICPLLVRQPRLSPKKAERGDEGKAVRRGERRRLCYL